MFSTEAYAHDLYDNLPPGTFKLKWVWDPSLLFFLVLAFFYWRGLRAFRGPLPIKKWQVACYFLGIVFLVTAMLPPIDPLSDQLFFVHMIQHLMITNFGVPLMMLGAPFFISVRGLSPAFRRQVYFPLIRSKAVRLGFDFVSKPIVSLLLFEMSFWFWHVPYYYNLALLDDSFHLLEHACFAAASLLLWRNIIDPHPLRSRLSLPMRMLFVGAMMASNVILSSFLTFAETVWYAYDGRPLPTWWGWDHLEDQRLGGLIMWVPGEFYDVIVMTIIFFVWVGKEQAKDRRERMAAAERPSEGTTLEPMTSSPA